MTRRPIEVHLTMFDRIMDSKIQRSQIPKESGNDGAVCHQQNDRIRASKGTDPTFPEPCDSFDDFPFALDISKQNTKEHLLAEGNRECLK